VDSQSEKGLVLLFTGDGKGKSTAAFGQALRAAGQGLRVCVIQFVKGMKATGEARAFAGLGGLVEFHTLGSGFTWQAGDKKEPVAAARRAFAVAREKIESGAFDLVVLDELTYLVSYEMVAEDEVLALIASRPPALHLVITGRDASQGLLEVADLVTEMVLRKHHYREGVRARPGIEF